MALSRREWMRGLGRGPGWGWPGVALAARGREAWAAAGGVGLPPEEGAIRLDSNENPLGPGPHVVRALVEGLDEAGRYPTNAQPSMQALREALAGAHGVKPEQVVLGAGSGEILRHAVRVYCGPGRPLVTAAPSFEVPERVAERVGVEVKRVPVDAAGRLDLEAMAGAAVGAGLVFVCNPNNPTGTVHGAAAVAEFVGRVKRASPETAVLIDEAYHDYVTAPAYQTARPVALAERDVFITRTFSKAYGLAGLRIGYAVGQAATMEPLGRWALTFNQNVAGVAAALAALGQPEHVAAERRRNAEVRAFTVEFFRRAGVRVLDAQGNFVFVETGRPAADFREACRQAGVLVGRPFPPLDARHARISLGTLEEMRRATAVFAKVLGVTTSAAARGGEA